jgi:hypothetical protein
MLTLSENNVFNDYPVSKKGGRPPPLQKNNTVATKQHHLITTPAPPTLHNACAHEKDPSTIVVESPHS